VPGIAPATVPATPAFGPSGDHGTHFTEWEGDPGLPVNSPGFDIQQNCWAGDAGPQTIWAQNWHNWGVRSTQTLSPDGHVKVYPNQDAMFYTLLEEHRPRVADFTRLTAYWAHSLPDKALDYRAQAMFDIWTDRTGEIMIWTDQHQRNLGDVGGGVTDVVTIDGIEWDVYQQRHFCPHGNTFENDGQGYPVRSLDLAAIFRWLMAAGSVTGDEPVGIVQYGFEMCSTGGQPLDFVMQTFYLDYSGWSWPADRP
jgi:hypothetical protein